jgi:tetratricopeptide (TPR) repeat protein
LGTTRSLDFDKELVSVKEILEKALRLNHNNTSALQYLGTYFLRAKNDLEKARYYYQLAYSKDSTNAFILNDLGVLASDQHDYEGAVDMFRKALDYNPNLIEAQYNLVRSYGILGQSGKASQEMKKYKELEPELNWSDVAEKSIEQLKK